MPRIPKTPTLAVTDPILLWLLIHGGDPAPDERTARLSASLAIQSLATHLSAGAAREVRATVGKEIAAAARAFEQG